MTQLESLPWQRWLRALVIVAALWSAALLGAALLWTGDAFPASVARIGAELWAATLALLALNLALRFARWHWMLRVEGYRLAAGRSLAVFLGGLALLPTPGKAGVAVRSLLLKRDGVPVNVTLAAYVSERTCDFVGLVALAAMVLAEESQARWALALGTAALGVVGLRAAPAIVAPWHRRAAAGSRAQRALGWAHVFARHTAELAAGRHFVLFVLIGALANICTGALFLLALSHFGVALPPADAIGYLAIAHLSGSLSMLPGGLGGFEVALLAAIAPLPIAAAESLAVLILVRIATIWGSVVVGLPLLLRELRSAGRPSGPLPRDAQADQGNP